MENNKELIIETYDTAQNYMLKLIKGIEVFNNYICSNNISEAIKIFASITEGMEWLINALKLTKTVQAEEIDIDEMTVYFPEMMEGIENEDYILVGDILEYEIKPIFEKWSGGLN